MSKNSFDLEINPISIWGKKRATEKRKKFSRTDEKAIFGRYKGRCAICGRQTEFYDGEVDHIKSLAKGGSNSPSNLQWLCHRCNKLKGSKRTNEQVKELLGLKRKRTKRRGKKRVKRKRSDKYDIFGLPKIKPIKLGI